MTEIISVHSYRGGTGKSNLVANMAVLMAMKGYRVGIVDTDIQTPGVHVLFGLDEERLDRSLNDYLWGRKPIEATAFALHEFDDPLRPYLKDLKLWLIPCSIDPNDIARVLREGYDVNLLQRGYHQLMRSLQLDYLLIDTHPGLEEETLLAIAMSSTLVLILRTDKQDIHGTAVTVEIARKLEVPNIYLVVNQVPTRYDFAQIERDIAASYGVAVAGLLPLSEDVAANASEDVFAALHPNHVWTQTVRTIADKVIR